MAEQALAEFKEKTKQTTDYYEKVRKSTPGFEDDEQIAEEIDKMRNGMAGPDGQMEEVKLPVAIQMSRYPSMESVDYNFIQPYLTRRERREYEQKKRNIDAKMEIAHTVLVERTSLQKLKNNCNFSRQNMPLFVMSSNDEDGYAKIYYARPNFTPPGYPDLLK